VKRDKIKVNLTFKKKKPGALSLERWGSLYQWSRRKRWGYNQHIEVYDTLKHERSCITVAGVSRYKIEKEVERKS